ncbi:MAG: hypothetical protein HZB19_09340 [Chloroflexi bacterium]|nr:hypothetical protein [Chloroflexota bacterium]
MKFKILQWIAIVLIIVTGYLHFITAPKEYGEAPYMGWLFFANFFGALVSASGIYRRKIGWGWLLGVVIAAGSMLGYIQSRTLGMPGMEVEEWPNVAGITSALSGTKNLAESLNYICGITPMESGGDFNSYGGIGLSAMFVEGLFLTVFALAKPWAVSAMSENFLAFSNAAKRLTASRFFTPALMLATLLIGVGSYQLGRNAGHGSEHPLPETVISAQTLEEEYGIQMTLVAVTAAGGLVDVRYKVIDPEKAAKLATEDGIMPMVYVENSDVMLMPDAHMRTQKLIADRMYFSLIPNAKNVVKRGASVIVVFDDIALEPMITQ